MISKSQKKWASIGLFFLVAVAVRFLTLKIDNPDTFSLQWWLVCWGEGIGPCLGALLVVLLLGRKFYCSIMGASVIKSVISVAIPVVVCAVYDLHLGLVLLGFIFYSFLEEVGWRGYLQGELKNQSTWVRVLLIGTMWLLWHVNIGLTVGTLIFWGILLLGAWGIGRIADDTHSLMLCACFHTLFNFSNHGFFEFTTTAIILYVLVIISWFVIWYFPWKRKK